MRRSQRDARVQTRTRSPLDRMRSRGNEVLVCTWGRGPRLRCTMRRVWGLFLEWELMVELSIWAISLDNSWGSWVQFWTHLNRYNSDEVMTNASTISDDLTISIWSGSISLTASWAHNLRSAGVILRGTRSYEMYIMVEIDDGDEVHLNTARDHEEIEWASVLIIIKSEL